jgi:nitrate reductase alpha subunit
VFLIYKNLKNYEGNLHDSHLQSKLKDVQMEKIKEAFNIRKDYEPGTAFDIELQEELKSKRLLEKKAEKKRIKKEIKKAKKQEEKKKLKAEKEIENSNRKKMEDLLKDQKEKYNNKSFEVEKNNIIKDIFTEDKVKTSLVQAQVVIEPQKSRSNSTVKEVKLDNANINKETIKKEENEDIIKCQICFDPVESRADLNNDKKLVVLECNHFFHRDCIKRHILHNGKLCSLCRCRTYIDEWLINPQTNKKIKIDGMTYKKLIQEGVDV